MACNIYDISVKSNDYNSTTLITDSIIVSGKVSECSSGNIQITVIDAGSNIIGQSNITVDGSIPGEAWEWELKVSIPCGSTVRVIVECTRQVPECKVDSEYTVDCCHQPPVTILVTNANTGVQVDLSPDPDTGVLKKIPPGDYKFTVTSPTEPSGLIYDWTLPAPEPPRDD